MAVEPATAGLVRPAAPAYVESVRRALAERRAAQAPRVAGLAIWLVVGLAGFLSLATFVGMMKGVPTQEFAEGRAVNALSAILLSATAALALACFLLHPARRDWQRWFWLASSAAFLFLAMDELIEIHEYTGARMGSAGLALPSYIRNWNDVIVLGYGAGAALFGAAFLPEVIRWPRVMELLAVAALFYAIHTAIDSTIDGWALKDIAEEGAKLYSSGFFALAMLGALLALTDHRSRT